MKGCPDDNLLVAYGAGSLPEEEARSLEAHLGGCETCRTLAAEALKDDADWAPAASEPSTGPDGELGPGAVLGRYVVLAALGAGGMGTVVSAYDPRLERRVAIKLLHAEAQTSESADTAQARLLREAQAMARLAHPNVVSVFDVGTWGSRVFIAMEFVDGGTLRSWCAQPGRTRKEILKALMQAGRGLEAAHAAGLVHRDFKPDNVLVSRDGRVLVTDFGLAHAHPVAGGPHREETEAAWRRLEEELPALASTQTGALVGTPAYMAPEQLIGRQADVKSDQFAFCATAWEALTGKRPFEFETLTQLAASLVLSQRSSGSPTPSGRLGGAAAPIPPPEVRLPGHVQRTLLKGLRLAPEERHEDLSSLLRGLSTDLTARRRSRWLMAGLSVALVSGAAAWTWQWAESRALQCSGSAELFQATWAPARQDLVRQKFVAADAVEGPRVFRRIEELIAARGEAWGRMHTEACEATRIRGEQSEEVLSLRMACLDRRLRDVEAMGELFETADAELLTRAIDAVERLPPLATCADVTALMAPVPIPTDPAAREAVAALSARLADVRARFLGGRFTEGLPEARAVWEEARALEHAPTLAEAGTLLGMFLLRLGESEAASETLRSAILAGDRGRDDLQRAEAAIAETSNQLQRRRLDAAEAQWQLAEAALDRLGTVTPLRGDLTLLRGRLDAARGDLDAALDAYRRAAERYALAFGRDSQKRSAALGNMAGVLRRLKRPREAGVLLEEAMAIRRKNVGDRHPTLVTQTSLLAALQSEAGQHDAAIATMERALSLTREFFPPSSPQWTWSLDSQGTILQAAGDPGGALAAYEASLALKQEHLPEGHRAFYFSHDGIGQCLLELGRADAAVPHLEQALALVGEDDLVSRADTTFALARALSALKRDPQRVLALLDEAAAGFEKGGDLEKLDAVRIWRRAQPGRARLAQER